MNKHRTKQSGFSSSGVLATILIVVVIIVIGVFVVNHDSKKTVANQTKAGSTTQTSDQPIAKDPASQTDQSVLAIKEWGIQLALPENIKGAYYTTIGSNTSSDGVANTAWLGLTSLNNAGCNIAGTGPTDNAVPVGDILRISLSDRDPVTGSAYPEEYPNGVTINGYYYTYLPWKNRKCASGDAFQAIDSSFTNSIKGATAARVSQ